MFDFLKNNKPQEQEPAPQQTDPLDNITADDVKSVIAEIRAQTMRQAIYIKAEDGDGLSLTASKFGGLPYIPHDGKTPTDNDGRQLRLLAQLNLADLPENSVLPHEGIMQFWALNNDLIGLDFKNNTANNTSRVTYFEHIDMSVAEDEVRAKYSPWLDGEDYFPIQDEFALKFTLGEEGISSSDCAFEDLLVKKWNEKHPDMPIEETFDLPEDALEDMYNEISGFGHKIGGYPGFTQWDPRSADDEHSVLLLQIDSVGTDEHEIMWGDVGIANFFISPDALDKRDFTGVLYNWDCG